MFEKKNEISKMIHFQKFSQRIKRHIYFFFLFFTRNTNIESIFYLCGTLRGRGKKLRVQKQLGEKESCASRPICLSAAGRVSRVNHRWPLIRLAAAATHNRSLPLSIHVCKRINLLHVQLRLTSRALETSARCTLCGSLILGKHLSPHGARNYLGIARTCSWRG